jgi:hypothetical protein
MPTWEDKRRIGDGWLALVHPYPKTQKDIEKAIVIVNDGIRALQSTDDLGHPRVNQKAWNMMRRLEEKVKRLKKRLKT